MLHSVLPICRKTKTQNTKHKTQNTRKCNARRRSRVHVVREQKNKVTSANRCQASSTEPTAAPRERLRAFFVCTCSQSRTTISTAGSTSTARPESSETMPRSEHENPLRHQHQAQTAKSCSASFSTLSIPDKTVTARFTLLQASSCEFGCSDPPLPRPPREGRRPKIIRRGYQQP